MFTWEIKEAISLLKEIEYMQGRPIRGQSLPEASRTKVRKLLDCLCREGLLRVMDRTGCDPLYFRYTLCHPLQEITLCDILRVTGGTIHLSVGDTKEIYENYGMAGRRLGVMNDMACHFLSEINLTEIVLPEVPTEMLPEEISNPPLENPKGACLEKEQKPRLKREGKHLPKHPEKHFPKYPAKPLSKARLKMITE